LVVLAVAHHRRKPRYWTGARRITTLAADERGADWVGRGGRDALGGCGRPAQPFLLERSQQKQTLTEPTLWRRTQATGPTDPPALVAVPCFEASAWHEADQLFRRDPHWVGGDGASSVDLGDGRILWLFGDSWIDPSGQRTRQSARMVSNSVAIQVGADPATASIRFYWGRAADGSAAALIPDEGDERHWFGNGVRVGDRLLLFLNRVRGTDTGIGFESVGWTAWMVANPDAEPSTWRMTRLATPPNPLGVLVGFAAVLRLGEHVFAFGSQDPVKSHPIYAVRWPVPQARQGALSNPEWWAGERLGWVPDSSAAPRQPLFEKGQSELTIHGDEATERFLAVQTQGFGPADVMMRAAPALTGPWSESRMLYRPLEYYRPNVMIYSAKAHPELTGAHLVLTVSQRRNHGSVTPRDPTARNSKPGSPTRLQGQYLAFIHTYTKVHRIAPAESDMQHYFRVTPPSVHQMVLTLERRA
jgi:hypothetical protein